MAININLPHGRGHMRLALQLLATMMLCRWSRCGCCDEETGGLSPATTNDMNKWLWSLSRWSGERRRNVIYVVRIASTTRLLLLLLLLSDDDRGRIQKFLSGVENHLPHVFEFTTRARSHSNRGRGQATGVLGRGSNYCHLGHLCILKIGCNVSPISHVSLCMDMLHVS